MSASPVPDAGAAGSAGPIADLSYRGYEGPLRTLRCRWWIIARMMLHLSLRRKGFWVLAGLALLPYLFPGFLLYLRSQVPEQIAAMLGQRPFSSFFYEAFSQSQLWLFLMALLVGAGSIAGDLRANALQIYLSKPVSRGDYLAGKWLGIFLVLAAAALVPALALFLYCWGSFRAEGFWQEDPYLWARVLGASLLPPLLHSGLVLGFSSRFRRPLLAGGVYAGCYFGVQVLAGIAAVILRATGHPERISTALHMSVPGVLRGLGQHLYQAEPSFFGRVMRAGGGAVERPDLTALLVLFVLLAAGGIVLARSRVRAVEVVRG